MVKKTSITIRPEDVDPENKAENPEYCSNCVLAKAFRRELNIENQVRLKVTSGECDGYALEIEDGEMFLKQRFSIPKEMAELAEMYDCNYFDLLKEQLPMTLEFNWQPEIPFIEEGFLNA